MVLTSSQICSMLFREVGNGFYKCTTCDKQYKEGNGYTNLLNHLRRNHDDYEQEAEEASRRQNPLRLHLVSMRTRDLYRWIEWVVCDRLPFAFVERRLTRLNTALSSVRGHAVEVHRADLRAARASRRPRASSCVRPCHRWLDKQ
ncbi:hypothetical protein PF007_g30367 [Phytophthora fragariae]|uniref:BED-type domain-containing protein n=1 Tax=Phytophthora fragariae TaxID=53985 RepID=A0A6A3PZI1_9STRA|nr:hypothetical protein PF009_g30879 [Phytophthora fragariae]KAE9061121.1 hypothetical protein PF007_g30367 [Phytophthora fragariae]KAE9065769.1 hypothetical protein PF006_g30384 [Phytophthora fragariae]KAE9266600.1 hypothetical protein PF001_g30410 [Phytophthora fragariae]